jgi:hypothetical protein
LGIGLASHGFSVLEVIFLGQIGKKRKSRIYEKDKKIKWESDFL